MSVKYDSRILVHTSGKQKKGSASVHNASGRVQDCVASAVRYRLIDTPILDDRQD